MSTKKTNSKKRKKPARARATAASKGSKKPAVKKKTAPRKQAVLKKKAAKKIAPKKAGKRKSPAKSEKQLFSIRALAKLFELSENTIREYIKENGGPVEERLGARRAAKLSVVKWHRFFMERQAGTASPLLDARTEKTQIEAASKRLEHKLRAGQVIEVETVIEFFTQVMLSIGTSLDGISGKSAEGDAVLRAQFLKEVRNARTGIHNEIESYLDGIRSGIEFSLTATGPGHNRMGDSEEENSRG